MLASDHIRIADQLRQGRDVSLVCTEMSLPGHVCRSESSYYVKMLPLSVCGTQRGWDDQLDRAPGHDSSLPEFAGCEKGASCPQVRPEKKRCRALRRWIGFQHGSDASRPSKRPRSCVAGMCVTRAHLTHVLIRGAVFAAARLVSMLFAVAACVPEPSHCFVAGFVVLQDDP